jgi:hypothetical protein
MKINKISITAFRSIQSATIEAGPFNVFVGQNNHGKTNLFEAVEWFYTGKGEVDKIRFGRAGEAEIAVEIEFGDIKDGLAKMRNERNRASIEKVIGEQDSVRIRRSSIDPKNRKIYSEAQGGWLEKNPAGFDAALNDFLPKLEYVSTAINPMDYAKYGKNTPISNMLSGVLTAILEQNKEYQEFRAKFDELFSAPTSEVRLQLDELSGRVQVQLEKQFPDCTKVVFEVAPPVFDDLLKSFDTSIDDGVYTDAREKGDGMQRALMLAILQTYCAYRRDQEEGSNKLFSFFIDEGELHLHPSAQRKLKNALLEIARAGDQVFINTHSSVLVVDDDDVQSLFRVEKIDKETSVTPITSAGKPSVVYELLGGSPADLLLPRNFLIVEGTSEVEFLNKVIERFYADQPVVQLIPANGDAASAKRSFAYISGAYRHLHGSIYADKLVVLVDHQNDRAKIDQFKQDYPALEQQGQLRELAVGSLEESYPDPWKKTAQQVQGMNGDQKVRLAREAGDAITQAQFEGAMPEFLSALTRAWERAFA